MTKSKNTLGFSVVEALLLLVIISVLGFTGWYVYHARQTSDKNYAVAGKDLAATSNTSTNTQAGLSVYTLPSVGASFSYPSSWGSLDTSPNGVTLESSDFQSAGGFSKISKGASLTVRYQSDSNDSDTEASLTTQAFNQANSTPTSSKFITVAGLRAIEFSHSWGENQNQHLVVLFVKDGKQYIIEQQFNLKGQNPYPDLINGVVSSFKFGS